MRLARSTAYYRRWSFRILTATSLVASLGVLILRSGVTPQPSGARGGALTPAARADPGAVTDSHNPPVDQVGFSLPAGTIPPAPITAYGTARSFRSAAFSVGGSVRAVAQPVPGWVFLPGQAVAGAVLGTGGSVIMGNEPQTGDQAVATADTMAVSVFDPLTLRFQNVIIPTSAGATSVTEPGAAVGGADISGLVGAPATRNRVAFVSLWPYHGWSTGADGEYPSFGYLVRSPSGTWSYQAGSGRTAAEIGASGPPGTCVPEPSASTVPLADCRGPASVGVLPASGDLAIAQYLDDPGNSRDSGGLMVLDPTGRVVGSYTYPNISVDGHALYVFPREIDVDPTSVIGQERFIVIFDVFGPNAGGKIVQQPFTLQEFEFDAQTGRVSPMSAPIFSGQSVAGHQEYFETAHFDQQGNLWAAQSVVGNITGGSIVEYSAATVAARLTTGACSADLSWSTTQWGLACPPDTTFRSSIGAGLVRSVTEDVSRGSMIFATISGALVGVFPTSNPSSPWTASAPVDFGLNELVDRSVHLVTPRQGVIDPSTETLWLPVEQDQTARNCNPAPVPCQPRPAPMAQWLFRIDLTQVFASNMANGILVRSGDGRVVPGSA